MGAQKFSSLPIYSLRLVKDKTLKYPIDMIDHPEQAIVAMQAYLQDRDREYLAIIMLDGQNKMIGINTIAIGGMHSIAAGIKPADVLKTAILANASGIICGHNHPSASLEPSQQDIAFTNALKTACEVMGLILLDHIIVSSGIPAGTMSFHQKGLL